MATGMQRGLVIGCGCVNIDIQALCRQLELPIEDSIAAPTLRSLEAQAFYVGFSLRAPPRHGEANALAGDRDAEDMSYEEVMQRKDKERFLQWKLL